MTTIWKRLSCALLALVLSLVPCFALPMSVSAFDPYAQHGLCITEFALGEEGYTEDPGNSNIYGWSAGWCAMFIGWCAQQAGILDIVPYKTSPEQYRSHYNGLGMYRAIDSSFDPQVGDLLFTKGTFSSPDHISIVVETTDENVITMDGNWGADDEGRVAKVTRAKNDSTIVAYVRPNYTTDHHYNAQEIAGNETAHRLECQICDYIRQEDHFCFIETDNYNHWEECGDCGFIREVAPHIWMVGGTHHLCEYCGLNKTHEYVWDKTTTKHIGHCFCGKELTENHVFPAGASRCTVCGYRPGDAIIMSKETEEIS